MSLRQTIQAAPAKTSELITKLSNTSNQAIKTREALFAELSTELTRYVELEEQHLLPLLRKHPDTKALAAEALKGNKVLRATCAELAALPKDDDAFLTKLAELHKGFQQHVRDERKELLPAVLEALSDEEARELAGNIEGGIAAAENARREEKRDEARRAKREADEAEHAAEAQRSAARAQKAAARSAREATDRTADTIQRGAASAQESARQMTAKIAEHTEQVASAARGALTVYRGSAQKTIDDMRAVFATSEIAAKAVSEIGSAWMDWVGKAARTSTEASQQLLRCRTIMQVAEVQTEFVTSAMRNWMERKTKMLEIAERTSKQALRPLEGRLGEQA